jgi:hypothetical protein
MAHLRHKIGASDIHDGIDTHRNGSDTPDWRDWHSFKHLSTWFESQENTQPPTLARSHLAADPIDLKGVGMNGIYQIYSYVRQHQNQGCQEKGLTAQVFASGYFTQLVQAGMASVIPSPMPSVA